MKVSKANLKIYSLFAFIVLCWAVSWSIGKEALVYIPAFYLITLRLIIATACFFLIALFLGKLVLPQSRDLPLIFTIGVLQFFFFTFLSLWGLKYIDVGSGAMLSYTTPIWVPLFTYLLFKEPLSKIKIYSVLLGGVGIMLILNPFAMNWHNKGILLGDGLLLFAAITWALAILSARYLTWHRTPLEMAPWQFLLAAVISLVISYLEGTIVPIHWNITLISSVLYMSIIATGICFWGMTIISKELPAITTSLGLLAVPVLSLIISHFWLKEVITPEKALAMIFILMALGFSVYDDNRKKV